MTQHPAVPLQPLLSDALVALRAPTQVWSGEDGEIGATAVEGIYHGDVRHVRLMRVSCRDSGIEPISRAVRGPSALSFEALLRDLDDAAPDPRVRLRRDRHVEPGEVTETWTVSSAVSHEVSTTFDVVVEPEFAAMHDIKSGQPAPAEVDVQQTPQSVSVISAERRFTVEAEGADVVVDDGAVRLSWTLTVPPHQSRQFGFSLRLEDPGLAVAAPATPSEHTADQVPAPRDPRAGRWLDRAMDDLDALRLALPEARQDAFFAAGAPWFFTLFGRDSVWAARLAMTAVPGMSGPTLRALARLQGTQDDPATAQEPGKILHELRSATLTIPGEGVELPPLYFGSVDSTPLWICLLAEARRAGLPDAEVAELIPALRGALRWILEHGDGDGDGFLDYIDRTGHGLANQGWKDSGDSIQWRSGALAQGPIALCEVQGYAYEAVLAGADLLEEFSGAAGEDDADDLTPERLRLWAADLRERFARHYWVQTPEGSYPAIALDRDKQPVDTLTSNIGHLIGTGILDSHQERQVAALLLNDSMSSGYGIRTMSTRATGYWPLSYHGGSVWMHDTAIVVHGMLRAGLHKEAAGIAEQMLDAAEGFDYRAPELQSGDAAVDVGRPVPYPAACRPQAWSAAAAVVCAQALAAAEQVP